MAWNKRRSASVTGFDVTLGEVNMALIEPMQYGTTTLQHGPVGVDDGLVWAKLRFKRIDTMAEKRDILLNF